MINRRLFLLIALLSIFETTTHSKTVKLSGLILDGDTNIPVPFVPVFEVENRKGFSTNEYGKFEIYLKIKDSIILEASHLQYIKTTLQLKVVHDTCITIIMQPKVINLDNVILIESRKRAITSSSMLKNTQITNIPALGGEKDVLKTFQFTPGVLPGNEGSIGLNVRGGGSDQNLFLIDDMPIYSPTHLFGFFSTFNTDIIQQAELYRADLPANYGGKLSSVLDIKTKRPSFSETHGSYTLGVISAKAFIETPIQKNRSGLILSFRRTYLDLLGRLQAMNDGIEDRKKISFYDFHLKYEHLLNRNNVITIQHIQSKDFFYNLFSNSTSGLSDKSGVDWYGSATFINYKYLQNNNSYKMLLGVNNYSYDYINENYTSNGSLVNSFKKSTEIKDVMLKFESEFQINNTSQVIYGGSQILHTITPLKMNVQKRELCNIRMKANETAIFAHLNMKLFESDLLSIGLRQTAYYDESSIFFPLEPRINYKKLLNWGDILVSFSRNVQFIHRIEDYSTGLPTETWYASNKDFKLEECYQISSELKRSITQLGIDIGVAAYYKWMNGLMENGAYYADFALTGTFGSPVVEVDGHGQAYGLEMYCYKGQGDFNFTLTYLLSNSIRKFEHINNNQWYPSNMDKRHNFNTTASYMLNESVSLSTAWVYSSGKPITIPEGKYYSHGTTNATLNYTGNRNNYRLSDYHRLDFSVKFKKVRRLGTGIWEIGLYNAYNRHNPYCLAFEVEKKFVNNIWIETGKVLVKQFSLFSMIPSISYTRLF